MNPNTNNYSQYTSDAFRIGAKYYISRIVQAWFYSLVLGKFYHIGIRFKHSILDLGCSNGTFGFMLQEAGLINSIDFSLDYSLNKLQEFRSKGGNKIVCGNVISLPFRNCSFNTVIANTVIASVPTKNESDIDRIFSEVSRILNDSGLFVLTVPTFWFNRNLLIPKILDKIRLYKMRLKYIQWIERNVDHYQVYDEEKWIKKLEQSYFQIEKIQYFFSPYQGFWWNIFSLPVITFWFKLFKKFKIKLLDKNVSIFLERIFSWIISKEGDTKKEQAGFILITAYKNKP